RPATHLFIDIAQEQRTMMSVVHIRRARCDCPSPQFQFQPEILDDLIRKETDEIGITRQTRVVIGKTPLRSCRPSHVTVCIQRHYDQAGAREISSSNKAIMTSSEDDYIVFRLHQ